MGAASHDPGKTRQIRISRQSCQSVLAKNRHYILGLSGADFQKEATVLGEQWPDLTAERPIGVQSVAPAIERQSGVVISDLALQPGYIAAGDIGRIGDDDVERATNGARPGADDDVCASSQAEGGEIRPRLRRGGRREIDANAGRVTEFLQQGA